MPVQLLDGRQWPTIVATPITVANFIVTVPDTYGMRVKQKATLSIAGLPAKEFEIRRVLSDTQIHLGELDNKDFRAYANPVEYSTGTLTIFEQERNKMGAEIYARATYEEDPVIAWRTLLVDPYGHRIDSVIDQDGLRRLAVDSTITLETLTVDIDYPNTPTIFNISTTANVENSVVLPPNTGQFMVKVRNTNGFWRVAFESGDTASNYVSLHAGSCYESGQVELTGQSVYFLTQTNSIVEVHTWSRP